MIKQSLMSLQCLLNLKSKSFYCVQILLSMQIERIQMLISNRALLLLTNAVEYQGLNSNKQDFWHTVKDSTQAEMCQFDVWMVLESTAQSSSPSWSSVAASSALKLDHSALFSLTALSSTFSLMMTEIGNSRDFQKTNRVRAETMSRLRMWCCWV